MAIVNVSRIRDREEHTHAVHVPAIEIDEGGEWDIIEESLRSSFDALAGKPLTGYQMVMYDIIREYLGK